jgi:hypothetical protein
LRVDATQDAVNPDFAACAGKTIRVLYPQYLAVVRDRQKPKTNPSLFPARARCPNGPLQALRRSATFSRSHMRAAKHGNHRRCFTGLRQCIPPMRLLAPSCLLPFSDFRLSVGSQAHRGLAWSSLHRTPPVPISGSTRRRCAVSHLEVPHGSARSGGAAMSKSLSRWQSGTNRRRRVSLANRRALGRAYDNDEYSLNRLQPVPRGVERPHLNEPLFNRWRASFPIERDNPDPQ